MSSNLSALTQLVLSIQQQSHPDYQFICATDSDGATAINEIKLKLKELLTSLLAPHKHELTYTGDFEESHYAKLSSLIQHILTEDTTAQDVKAATQISEFEDIISKPQQKFTALPSNLPKPHSMSSEINSGLQSHLQSLGLPNSHKYSYEIHSMAYPSHTYIDSPPQPYFGFKETPFEYISTKQRLELLISDLQSCSEIAMDLEHHDFRSYHGLTCLIQISSRTKDYIIDALALQSHLYMLNEITANPKILKVLHGAERDIIWLQRDFGVYVVGLFDTYAASKAIEMERHSLAFLLETYCSFSADKTHQTSDWRVRPLPQSMINYARGDTHFLLYIFDCMRNECLSRKVMDECLEASRLTSLNTYVLPVYDHGKGESPGGWSTCMSKHCKVPVGELGTAVFKALHAWRDATARTEDESPAYVLPNRVLVDFSVSIPRNLRGVRRFIGGRDIAGKRVEELLDVINGAIEGFEKDGKAVSLPAVETIDIDSLSSFDVSDNKALSAVEIVKELPTEMALDVDDLSDVSPSPVKRKRVNRESIAIGSSAFFAPPSPSPQLTQSFFDIAREFKIEMPLAQEKTSVVALPPVKVLPTPIQKLKEPALITLSKKHNIVMPDLDDLVRGEARSMYKKQKKVEKAAPLINIEAKQDMNAKAATLAQDFGMKKPSGQGLREYAPFDAAGKSSKDDMKISRRNGGKGRGRGSRGRGRGSN